MTDAKRLIKSRDRVKAHGEVYTPEHIVRQMCDTLPEDAWDRIERRFLEPSCGNGNFLAEILRRKLTLCRTAQDGLRALGSIYGIDILPDNCAESRERLMRMYAESFPAATDAQMEEARQIIGRQIICGDSLKIMAEWAEVALCRT